MSATSSIEWTDSTWNPVTGCEKVSPGCDHCYAETFAERFRGTPGHYFQDGFDVQLRPDKLELPLRWRKSRRIFVNSMSDLFHRDVPDDYIAKVFAVMADSPRHTYQVLTKRHGRMRSLLSSPGWPELLQGARDDLHSAWDEEWDDYPTPPEFTTVLPNVWLGVTAENQQWADIRIPALLDTPAAVRFVSAEPLLGPIDLCQSLEAWKPPSDHPAWQGLRLPANRVLHWVIVGGESGRGARPMHPEWARFLRDECQRGGIPFFFKQWGEWGPAEWKPARLDGESDDDYKARAEAIGATHAHTGNPLDGDQFHIYEPNHRPWSVERGALGQGHHAPIRRWGKAKAGRVLDGCTWDQRPDTVA